MTATLDTPAHRLFREALDLIRTWPLDNTSLAPALAGWPGDDPPLMSSGGEVTGRPGDLWGLAGQVRSGRRTIPDLLAESRDRIDRHDAAFHAFEYVADTAAITAQMAAEARAGRWRGPLHGLPLSIKDVIDVAGMPTGSSSDAYPDRVAEHEGLAVRRLRAAGAIFTGKATTHEFALGVTTPQSRNPWDAARIPGGSSGGSAISIVTGMAAASLGTDTRASIRVPAALSGVVGYKASFGRVPADGLVTLSWSMDHLAPMGRSVRDIALLMDVLTDAGDAYRAALPGSLAGKQLLCAPTFLDGADPDVTRIFHATLSEAERAGAEVIMRDAPTADDLALANAAGMIISRCEAATYHEEIGTDLARCTPETHAQLAEAAGVPATDYLRAQRLRAALRDRYVTALGDADAFIMPTSKVLAPRVEDAGAYLLVLSENCIPWSLIDLPAISLPAGSAGRLPVGVQIVGRPHADRATLALARALESLLPPLPEWKPVAGSG